MKKITIVISLLIVATLSFAQGLVNNGANIHIYPEAYVYLNGNAGNLTNQASGTIDLDGYLTAQGNLVNNATFNINSGASFINNGTVSGTTTVKRSLSANQAHYISSPISGGEVNDFAGGFVFQYSEQNSDWTSLETGSLEVMKAYSVEFLTEKTVNFSGNLNSGTQQINLTNDASGWNLVGNPYTSALNWDNAGWTKTDIDATFYLWNGTNYSYYGTADHAGNSLFINNATEYIPAMQGFFVKVKTGVTNGELSVTNQARVHNAEEFYKKTENKTDFQHIRLVAKGNNYEDETLIAFFAQADNEFNSKHDAYKLFTTHPEVPQIYTTTNKGTELAINSLPECNEELVLNCNFTAGENGNYSISVRELNLENISKIYLEDKNLSKFSELAINDEYTFDYLISDDSDRFKIHFTQSALGVEENSNIESNITIFAIAKEVHIQSVAIENSKSVFSVFDLSGKLLMQKNLLLGYQNTVKLENLQGTYLVKLLVDGKEITKKVFLK